MAGAVEIWQASLPLEVGRVTSPWGWRNRPSGPDLHTGVDFGAPEGTVVLAVMPGRVRNIYPTGAMNLYGNTIVLEHSPDLFSLYSHLKRIAVLPGDLVDAGVPIGEVGRTAGTKENPSRLFAKSGAHLHFEFLEKWPPGGRDLNRLNPAPIFAELGIIVPPKGELKAAVGTPAARLSPTLEPPILPAGPGPRPGAERPRAQ